MASHLKKCASLTEDCSRKFQLTGTSEDNTSRRLQHSKRMTHPTYFSYTLQIRTKNSSPGIDLAVEIMIVRVRLHSNTDWEETIFFYIALIILFTFCLLNSCTMCISLTPVLFCIITVLIEILLLCFIESVSLSELGERTSRADISSPHSFYLKALKGAHFGPALTGATSKVKILPWKELT